VAGQDDRQKFLLILVYVEPVIGITHYQSIKLHQKNMKNRDMAPIEIIDREKIGRREFLETMAKLTGGVLSLRIFAGLLPEIPLADDNKMSQEKDDDNVVLLKDVSRKEKIQDVENILGFNPAFLVEELTNLAIERINTLPHAKQKEATEYWTKLIAKQFATAEKILTATRFPNENATSEYADTLFARKEEIKKSIELAGTEIGVPVEILWGVLCVESAGDPPKQNIGEDGPRGMFQMSKGVAESYGLKINKTNDERFSLSLSAKAVAKYLNKLHNRFGQQWGVALLAFRHGEGVVSSELIKMGARQDGAGNYPKEDLAKKGLNAASITRKSSLLELYPFIAEICGTICAEEVVKQTRENTEETQPEENDDEVGVLA